MRARGAAAVRTGVLALVAFGIGFGTGRFVAPDGEPRRVVSPLDLVEPPKTLAGEERAGTVTSPAYDTLAEILTIPSDFEQTAVLYALASRADRAQLEALIVEGETLERPIDRQGALSILLARLAELEPDAALRYVADASNSRWSLSVVQTVARLDLEKALGYAWGLDDGGRRMAVLGILRVRDDLDAAERQRIAAEFGLGRLLQQRELQRATMKAAVDDPPGAWRDALADDDLESRERRLRVAAMAWGREDPAAALAAIAALDRIDQRVELEREVVTQWGRRAPRDALEWLRAKPSSPSRAPGLRVALGALARDDPYTAASIALGLTVPRERRFALAGVLSAWAGEDPRAAAAWIDGQSDPAIRGDGLASVLRHYARMYPLEAFDWMATLPAAVRNRSAFAAAIKAMAQSDPRLASRLLRRIPSQEAQGYAAHLLVIQWAQQDVRAAARWAMELSAGAARRQALPPALAFWAEYEPDAVVAYLDSIYDPAEYDRLAAAIVPRLGTKLDLAERLYEGISDPTQKRRAAMYLYRVWRLQDLDRAERYREAAGDTASAPVPQPAAIVSDGPGR